MKKLALFLLWVSAAALLAAADFKTGLDAYNRGDFATALAEWQPIAERGDPNAQYNLGLLYARGQGVPQDYAKAAEWYGKAADGGVPAAEYNLGLMYANGQGVKQDSAEAAKWFQKAAEQDVTDAVTGLGNIYYEGQGSFRNYSEAEKWYRKAAENGVASAAFSIGVMYDIGQGVEKNYDEALKWYRQAADDGYPAAVANIGILYYNGQGVKRDLVQAYAWFARAQKLGDPRAGELVNSCTNKMQPRDIKKAQALVAQWQPHPKPAVQTAETQLFKAPPAEADRATALASASAAASPAPAPAGATNAAPGAPTPAPAEVTTAAPASATPATGTPAPAAPPAVAPAAIHNPPEERVQDVWTGVDRVIAVGDIHGDYEQFAKVLHSAGLIDGRANWVGGRTHLVQTGDVVDRGPDSRAIMDLLIKLEKQAAAAGGGVHALIGNHEAMDVYGDLRFVSPAEFAAFRTDGATVDSSFDYRKALTAPADRVESGTPAPDMSKSPGFAEHRAAFGPNGAYGRWIRSHNAAIKIDRTLFVHAGLGPKYADWSLERINSEVRAELNDLTRLHGGVALDEEGPLWYTGLAKGDEQKLEPVVDGLLKHFDVDRIVIGHTYADGAITPRFGGKVTLIDIGLSRIYDNIGKLGCLEIDHGQVYALHRGQRLYLPKDENGPDMLRYLKQAAALDPQPSPLEERIRKIM
ncbi:MAG TPA: metallophosphoesterase [Bryobacteraceae bacterium]